MARKMLNGLDLVSQKIVNLASPSASTDAVNKAYVDDKLSGLAWKAPVRAATTVTGTLATSYANSQVIDGVTLATGDRILIKDQAAGAENGIYTVNVSGAPTRATDMDITAEAVNNTTVLVQEGTVNADKAYTLSNNGTITLGTTALTFVQVGGGGGTTYVAGNGLTESPAGTFNVGAGTGITVAADTVAIDTSVVTRKYAVAVGDGSSTSITVTHNLNTRDVIVAIYDATTFEVVECDIVNATVNTVTLTFATAPTASKYRCVVMG